MINLNKKMKKLMFYTMLFSLLLVPSFSLAQGVTVSNDFVTCNGLSSDSKLADLFDYGTCIISNSIIPLLFALAVVLFVWGVVQYVINDGEEAKKAKGKQFMIWGIVGLAVMISVWGLVNILTNTFGVSPANFIPQVAH